MDSKGRHIVRMAPQKLTPEQKSKRRRTNGYKVNTEFGSATSAAKMIREEMNQLASFCKDGELCNNLAMHVYHQMLELPNARKARKVSAIDVRRLEGFQWNSKYKLEDRFKGGFASFADPDGGKACVIFERFNAREDIAAPGDAKWFKLFVNLAVLNPEEKECHREHFQTSHYLIADEDHKGFSVDFNFETEGYTMMLMGVGICFYMERYGMPKAIREGAFELVCGRRIGG